MSTQKREIQTLTIAEGPLGPLLPDRLEFAPFTILIGKQGTGKSLLSQVLYLFNHLPYLVPYYAAKLRQSGETTVPVGPILSACFKNLRSANGSFTHFVDKQLKLTYSSTVAGDSDEWSISLDKQRGSLPKPNESLRRYIGSMVVQSGMPAAQSALFIPTERLLYSQGNGPSIWQLLSLPVTLQFFADAMGRAAQTVDGWEGGEPDTPEGRWVASEAAKALSGSIRRRGDAWSWSAPGLRHSVSLPIDMASSGQRANWPLALLAQVLFSWRQSGDITEPFSLYVEEPEIHLHPEAQVALVRILAFLVHHGFRVVVTTHSLTTLYALNNLVLASSLGEQADGDIPEPAVRLRPEQVAAYALHPDGHALNIVDPATGFLSEVELGAVIAALGDQLNHIALLRDRVR